MTPRPYPQPVEDGREAIWKLDRHGLRISWEVWLRSKRGGHGPVKRGRCWTRRGARRSIARIIAQAGAT